VGGHPVTAGMDAGTCAAVEADEVRGRDVAERAELVQVSTAAERRTRAALCRSRQPAHPDHRRSDRQENVQFLEEFTRTDEPWFLQLKARKLMSRVLDGFEAQPPDGAPQDDNAGRWQPELMQDAVGERRTDTEKEETTTGTHASIVAWMEASPVRRACGGQGTC